MPIERWSQHDARPARWAILAALWAVVGGCADVRASDDLAARRVEIERMSPADQQELLRKQERFSELPQEERNRLRNLQAALDADAHAERLRQVLSRYHEWLKTLTPSQRAELADLPAEERVQTIKRIQRQQHIAQERAHREELLSGQDLRQIVRWTENLAWQRREQLLASMSEGPRKNFEKASDERQRRILLYRALGSERGRRGKGAGPMFSVEQADIDRLSAQLSEPARQELAASGGLPAERKLVIGWIGTALHRLEPGHAGRRLGPLAGEELAQFLQNDVPLPQRERLLKMPREQMLEELRAMYQQRGRRDNDLPDGSTKPWLDRKPSDRGRGEFRGRVGRAPDSAPAGAPPAESRDP